MTEPGKTPAKKTPAKKTPATKTTAKKTTAKKAPAKKTTAKRIRVKRIRIKRSPATTNGRGPGRARKLARSAPASKFFANFRTRAKKILDDPEALMRVAEESHSSGASRSGPFADVMDDFRTLVRLVVAYGRGHYRDIAPESMVMVVGGLLYVVSPLDVIPDPIPGLGFTDDAVVIAWVIKSVRWEFDAFRAWEIGQTPTGATG